jgi:hypothetical protein
MFDRSTLPSPTASGEGDREAVEGPARALAPSGAALRLRHLPREAVEERKSGRGWSNFA